MDLVAVETVVVATGAGAEVVAVAAGAGRMRRRNGFHAQSLVVWCSR